MERERKKLRETKFGKILFEKLPEAAALIGDVLPESGVLGIAKNIIENSTLSPEEKTELLEAQREYEVEFEKLRTMDRDSAREREISWIEKTGKRDVLMTLTGIIGLGAFLFMIVALVYVDIPAGNKEIFIHAVGIVEGVALSIFAYYFGSSKGSADKNKLLKL